MSLVNSRCEGRIGYPFPAAVRSVTIIAVGVGVAPMIQTIRAILRDFGGTKTGDGEEDGSGGKEGDGRFKVGQPPMQVVLLYGVVRAHTFLHVYIHFCTHISIYTGRGPYRISYCGSSWTNGTSDIAASSKSCTALGFVVGYIPFIYTLATNLSFPSL